MKCYEKYFRCKSEMDSAFEKIQRIIKEQGYISHRQYLCCCGIENPENFYRKGNKRESSMISN